MKAKLNIVYQGLAGKMGGDNGVVNFPSRNRQFVRTYVVPSNPNTTAQQLIRNTLTSISAAFSAISDALEADWLALANELPRTDIFGTEYKMYANNAFLLVNMYRVLDGQAQDTLAPSYVALPAITAITTSDVIATDLSLVFSHVALPANSLFFIRVSNSLGSGRRQARKTDFRMLDATSSNNFVVATGTSTPTSLSIDAFSLSAGDYVGFLVTTLTADYVPSGEFLLTNRVLG